MVRTKALTVLVQGAILLVACDAGQPPAPRPAPPAPKPAELPSPDPQPPPPPATRHRHAIPRKDLATPDTDEKLLPVHGIVGHLWGMAGDSVVVIDQDARTMHEIENWMGKPKVDRTRKLDAKKVDALVKAAYAAWDEDENGPMPQATDIREDLIILDGDEAFYLAGNPIGGGLNGTGRPAAGRAFAAMFEAAK